jgi:hypothetical protein
MVHCEGDTFSNSAKSWVVANSRISAIVVESTSIAWDADRVEKTTNFASQGSVAKTLVAYPNPATRRPTSERSGIALRVVAPSEEYEPTVD